MQLRPRLLATLLWFLSSLQAAGVIPDYALRTWNTTDGLPNNEVTYLLQDRRGYLWVAMTNGLARFDGNTFESYPLPVPTPLSPTGINTLMEDQSGGLLVAPRFGGLLCYKDNRFEAIPLPKPYKNRLVHTLMQEPSGTLWIGLQGGVLLRKSQEGFRVFDGEAGLNPNFIPYVVRNNQGEIWICCGELLAEFESNTLHSLPLIDAGNEVRIAPALDKGLWVVAADKLLKVENGRPREIIRLPSYMGAHFIQTIREDPSGGLWIGTRSRGLFRLHPGREPQSVESHDDIYALTHDRDGNLWVGSNGGGLTRVRRGMVRCFDKSEGLPENFSMTVCEDRESTLWMANRDGGLAYLVGGKVAMLPKPPEWRPFGVKALSPSSDGGIWVTSSHGLLKVTRTPAASWKRMTALPHLGTIRVAFTGRNGELWLAVDPDRVARLQGDNFTLFGAESGFTGGNVRSIAEDAEGRIWIGTANAQLFRFQEGRFERVSLNTSALLGAIQSLHFDDKGALWFATERNGLFRLREGQLHNLDTPQGFPESNLVQIVDDGRGSLWFGCSRSIFHLPKAELEHAFGQSAERVHPIVLGKDEGLREVTCLGYFQPNVWKSTDGLLWFATRQGIIAIDPSRDSSSQLPLTVRVESITLDEKPTAIGKPLRFPSSISKIEIRYSALCLSTPDRVRTRYRLDGFDRDWVLAERDNIAKYPKLPPGLYRFRASASIGTAGEPGQEDIIEFIIEPLWWQTTWFQLSLLLAGAAGIVVAVRLWSYKRLRRHVAQLEKEKAIEAERIRIARNIHDDLGANLTRISLLTQAGGTGGLDAAQAEKVYATVTATTRAMDEIVWAVNPRYDDLDSLVYYITNYAPSFLNEAGIRCRLDMPEHITTARLTSQIRHHLFLACREALNNVVKHAAASEVLLRLRVETRREEGHILELSIADNGRGFPSAPAAAGTRPCPGNGLNNMRTRMEELGGEFSIQAGEQGGTLVRLRLKINPSHFEQKS